MTAKRVDVARAVEHDPKFMVWAKRELLLLVAAAGLVTATAVWRLGLRTQKSAPPTRSSAAVSSSASAAPTNSADLVPRSALSFVYDCSGIGSAAPACSGVPAAAQALFQGTAWFRVSGAPCGLAISEKEAGALERALKDALALPVDDLKPLERALLQNAALKLLSCSRTMSDTRAADLLARSTRRVIERFALSAQRIAELPRANAQLAAWLGDSALWERGAGRTHLHELAEASALAHQTLRRADDFANVAELVLSDDQGVIHVTETAQRLLLRRPSGQTVRICVAQLDPAAARCSASGELSSVTSRDPAAILTPSGAPPCAGCHTGMATRGGPYGPARGLALVPAETERIIGALGLAQAAPH